MQDATRDVLRQFVELYQRLAGHRFTTFIRDNGMKLTLTGRAENDGYVSTITEEIVPDTEAIFAVTPTFRRFIQRDPVSFRSLQTVLSDQDVSQNWKDHYTAIRDFVNTYLDNPTPLVEIDDGTVLTCRSIIDVFFNGDIVHGEEPKRERMQDWKSDEVKFKIISFHFANIIAEVSESVFRLEYITRLELNGDPVPLWVSPSERVVTLKKVLPQRNSIFLPRARLKQAIKRPN